MVLIKIKQYSQESYSCRVLLGEQVPVCTGRSHTASERRSVLCQLQVAAQSCCHCDPWLSLQTNFGTDFFQSTTGIFSMKATSTFMLQWMGHHKQPLGRARNIDPILYFRKQASNKCSFTKMELPQPSSNNQFKSSWCKHSQRAAEISQLLKHSGTATLLLLYLQFCFFISPAFASLSPPHEPRDYLNYSSCCAAPCTVVNIIKANKACFAGSIVIWHWKRKILNEQCFRWCHTQGSMVKREEGRKKKQRCRFYIAAFF